MSKIKTNIISNKQTIIIVLTCSTISLAISFFWLIFGNTPETIALSSVAFLAGLKILKAIGIVSGQDKRSKWITMIFIAFLVFSLGKLVLPLFF